MKLRQVALSPKSPRQYCGEYRAIKIRYNIPSDAKPDHSQNQAVSNTSSQPPNVKNRTKKGTAGGETTIDVLICRTSAQYVNNPRIGVKT
jgi:hypothetical protein